jgi:spermidine synthase
MTNLNPVTNENSINRVLVLSPLVDKPRNVLMIGLSIGTWLKLVTTFPGVESIDVIEINPGYLQAISHYPEQASALQDPRVNLYIDDGRRWLRAHPDKRYDMVIMNSSYHWRAYSTYLLSREFLLMIKSHMNPDAVMTYNTTYSLDALKTAESVFPYAYLYENFVIAGNYDWRGKLNSLAAIEKLAALTMDGKLLYPPGNEALIKQQINKPLMQTKDIVPVYFNEHPLEIITDDNLITEFKYGKRIL